MGNLIKTFTVPTDTSPGTGVDCTALAAHHRTFVYVGVDGDALRIDGSNDDTDYAEITTQRGASWTYTVTDRCQYYRATRLAGTDAASLKLAGAEETTEAGPAGPPALGSMTITGTCSTTDATATTIASFTPGGNGGFSVVGHLVGLKDDETVYSTMVTFTWKKVAGTLTAIGAVLVGEQTGSLNPGDATAVASGGVAQMKVTGIAATNINWQFYGALAAVDAF